MKIIIDTDLLTDNVSSCSANTEDSNFPDENLRDDFPTNLWKAASGTTAVITLGVTKGSAVMLFNTNATSASVTVGSGETYSLETDFSLETGYSLAEDSVTSTVVYSLPGSGGRLWADYSTFTTPHVVTISLTAGSPVSAGIVRAGEVVEFKDPAPDFSEGTVDFSVEKELNDGADYFRKRNIVRTFDELTILETRANAYIFKHDIFDAIGPQPLAIRLVQNVNITDWEFVLFAKRTEPIKISFGGNHLFSRINFSLREVL